MELTYDKNRVNNFTDAIFAIAMTLLVLDLVVPSYNELTTKGFGQVMQDLLPKFIGYAVSFLVIALYWSSHMNISKNLKHYNKGALGWNIMLLFMVVLMPFTTSFYCSTFVVNEPFIIYSVNIIALSVFKYLMIRKIEKDQLIEKGHDPILFQWAKTRDLMAGLVWLFAIIVSLKFALLSRFSPLLLFPVLKFVDIVYKRKSAKRIKVKSRKKRT